MKTLITNSHKISMIRGHLIQSMTEEDHHPQIIEGNILPTMIGEGHQVTNMIGEVHLLLGSMIMIGGVCHQEMTTIEEVHHLQDMITIGEGHLLHNTTETTPTIETLTNLINTTFLDLHIRI